MPTRGHGAIAAFCLAAGSCAEADTPPATVAPPAGAVVAIASRASTTVTGQPLGVPHGSWESVISTSELPPGGLLPMHRHPWPRYVYIERGRLSVRYEESGMVREFGAGEAVVEAIDQWHEGRVVGPEPVRLIVFDQVPAGETNVVRR